MPMPQQSRNEINDLSMYAHLSDLLVKIVRCHSEGCDTKVYGVKASGHRYVCLVCYAMVTCEIKLL